VLLVTVAALYCILARCLRFDSFEIEVVFGFVCSCVEVLLIEFVEFNLR